MEEKKRIINLLTIINEEYQKNDKKLFKEFKYKTLGGDNVKIYVHELTSKPTFIKYITEAKKSNKPENQWRVDIPSEEELKDCKPYQTWGGCTFAIRLDGDIIAVDEILNKGIHPENDHSCGIPLGRKYVGRKCITILQEG